MSFAVYDNRVRINNRNSTLNLSTTDVTATNSIIMDNIRIIMESTGKITIGSIAIATTGNSITIGGDEAGDGNNSTNIGFGANKINANNSICIGYTTGFTANLGDTICIGHSSGLNNMKTNSISIGGDGCAFNGIGLNSIAVGSASCFNCNGINNNSIAIGRLSGYATQGIESIAIGFQCGYTGQSTRAIAIGIDCGINRQGQGTAALGYRAGYTGQGNYAIAIGYQAGLTNQAANSIILNADSTALNSTTSGFFVNPIRNLGATGGSGLGFNTITKEVYLSSKTFIIDHPLDYDKYLVHACLEGPEAGVYYRGKSEIVNGESVEIVLPEYTKVFSNFTVQISPIYEGKFNVYNTSEVKNSKFFVYGNNGKFSWVVHALRDHIDVEPIKLETEVNGDTPYKYIVYR